MAACNRWSTLLTTYFVRGKMMFSDVFVCLSMGGIGVHDQVGKIPTFPLPSQVVETLPPPPPLKQVGGDQTPPHHKWSSRKDQRKDWLGRRVHPSLPPKSNRWNRAYGLLPLNLNGRPFVYILCISVWFSNEPTYGWETTLSVRYFRVNRQNRNLGVPDTPKRTQRHQRTKWMTTIRRTTSDT